VHLQKDSQELRHPNNNNNNNNNNNINNNNINNNNNDIYTFVFLKFIYSLAEEASQSLAEEASRR
jgi:hypothetical protein